MGIQLREKKLADGHRSLYLDTYHDGKRPYKFLNIYLDKDRPANRCANRDKRHTATLRIYDQIGTQLATTGVIKQ